METPERDVISLYLRASRAAAALAYLGDRALAGTGLTMDELEVLAAIERKAMARKSITKLGRELGVHRSALSRRMERLEARGFVAIERWSRSRTNVELTEIGRNALVMLQERWESREERVREYLGAALPPILVALKLLTHPALGASERVAPMPGDFRAELPRSLRANEMA